MFETPQYRVTGTQPVSDHKPGEIFEADLDPAVEAQLLAGGHLTRLEPDRPAPHRARRGRGKQPADEQQQAADAAEEMPQSAADEEE